MSKFKPGDRVRRIMRDAFNEKVKIGDILTVAYVGRTVRIIRFEEVQGTYSPGYFEKLTEFTYELVD